IKNLRLSRPTQNRVPQGVPVRVGPGAPSLLINSFAHWGQIRPFVRREASLLTLLFISVASQPRFVGCCHDNDMVTGSKLLLLWTNEPVYSKVESLKPISFVTIPEASGP